MASAAFSNRLYRLDCSRLWFNEGLQTFLGSLRGTFSRKRFLVAIRSIVIHA